MPCQRKLLQKLFVNIGFGSSFVLCVAAFVSLLHKSFIVFFQLFFKTSLIIGLQITEKNQRMELLQQSIDLHFLQTNMFLLLRNFLSQKAAFSELFEKKAFFPVKCIFTFPAFAAIFAATFSQTQKANRFHD